MKLLSEIWCSEEHSALSEMLIEITPENARVLLEERRKCLEFLNSMTKDNRPGMDYGQVQLDSPVALRLLKWTDSMADMERLGEIVRLPDDWEPEPTSEVEVDGQTVLYFLDGDIFFEANERCGDRCESKQFKVEHIEKIAAGECPFSDAKIPTNE